MYFLITKFVLLSYFYKSCLCGSHDLSDEQYYKLPNLFSLENYEKCLTQSDGVYCLGSFEVIGQKSSSVYETLLILTNDTLSFNHTKIHRGVCLGSFGQCPVEGTWEESFEKCVDKEMLNKYGLNSRLITLNYCKNNTYKRQFDSMDYLFIFYATIIVFLNIIGTIYDHVVEDNEAKVSYLVAFSLRRNWQKLTNKGEPKHQQFLSFHGLKAILVILVNIAHAFMGQVTGYVPNPRYVELVGERPVLLIFFNGTVVIQVFIVMTCFLQTLKIFHDTKITNVDTKSIFTVIFDRFVRISPLFMTVTALSATLMPHMGDGPLWNLYEEHTTLCRNEFWRNFFMLQNFYPPSCLPQTWYLSIDLQLCIIVTALLVFLLKRKEDMIKNLISVLIASLSMLFFFIYFMGLKSMLHISTPENFFHFFKHEKSFVLLYGSIWGNFPSAVIGILMTCVFVHIKMSKYNIRKNKVFVLMFRLSIPVAFILNATGYYFLHVTSPTIVSLYATFDKPVYALIFAIFILGCLLEVESSYKNVVEWPGWVVLSRLSLASLLLHFLVNMYFVSTRLHPLNISQINIIADGIAVSVFTFVLSVPLCLMVEYPFVELYNILKRRKINTIAATEANNGYKRE